MALFLLAVGLPEELVAGMREAPMWSGMEAVAPTLAYDARVMGDGAVPAAAASVKAPALVAYGSATGAWAAEAARALGDVLPDVRLRLLKGQSHDVDWRVLAPVLREFLSCPGA